MQSFDLITLPNGWQVGRFSVLTHPALTHAITTKHALDVQQVRHEQLAAGGLLAAALGVREAAHVHQVHGGRVLSVDRGGLAGEADGLVTRERGLLIWMRGADCPLLLAADVQAGVVGCCHASWRGTVARVTEEMIRQMVSLGARAASIVVGLCPSAGPCCYEVGPEVRAEAIGKLGPDAAEFFVPRQPREHLDLWKANRYQLRAMGVPEERIALSHVCTLCRNDLFPSHRKEGDAAGRLAAGIALV